MVKSSGKWLFEPGVDMFKLNFRIRRVRDRLFRCNALTICVIVAMMVTGAMVIPQFLAETHGDGWPKFSDEDITTDRDGPFFKGCVDTQMYLKDDQYVKMNATFVMLTRNEESDDVAKTIRSIESHFNQWFQYPYVFLNDVPFTQEFKEKVQKLSRAPMQFGTVDKLDWEFPEQVRESFAFQNALRDQADRGILYGGEESYHKMCRFYSGLFYKHPLVRQFEWYWRLEPDVEFFCDLSYDPFLEMARNDKRYGFTIVLPELYWTVPNLFRYTRSFIRENKLKLGSLWRLFTNNYRILDTDDELLASRVNYESDVDHKLSEKIAIEHMFESGNSDEEMGLRYLVGRSQAKIPLFEDKFDDEEYNLCHFWSNFEIARLDVFDNEIYDSYFRYLEQKGGFWRERWGDAPVHSLGLGMTLNVEDVHYFRDIGYRHSVIQHCPRNWNGVESGIKVAEAQLPYLPADPHAQRNPLWSRYNKGVDYGCGCRCRCDTWKTDIEDTAYYCMQRWTDLQLVSDADLATGGHYTPKASASELESRVRDDYLAQLP
ncbi:hypothetical protein HG537_0A02140 [Torulaspora globosa]|uniref:Glycosyltransferase family 15 protein n=1 Tax=Torulaspora globosa TaxID=48254 RepID=A0A7H9HMI9_9SACH|nr:hypothetical protein HG537_0A02140 [Torulaspora sp. CBS 2947]